MDKPEAKLRKLEDILAKMGSVLIAYSGGADSTFLLKVALDVLGQNVLATTARAPIVPSWELTAAEEMAHQLGARHLFIETGVLDDPDFSYNPPDRCYICKRALFSRLRELASKHGLNKVIEGSNQDDLSEYRPGLRAVREFAVKSPLVEAGFTKAQIRSLSREMGLPTWNKPAQTCLATRFSYGEHLTPEKLKRVEEAEGFLHSLNLRQVRVRDHGVLARIEVPGEDMAHLLELASRAVDKLKELGYTYITLDLEGHRTGSMKGISIRLTPSSSAQQRSPTT
jgi:uncharacterized protein